MFGSSPVHIHLHQTDTDELLRLLRELKRGQAQILAQGAQDIAMNAETRAILDQINTFTNDLATEQASQGEKLAEIGRDLDDLIANTSDPELRARLEAHRDTLAAAAASAQSTSATLTDLASKHDAPIPTPNG